MQPERKLSLPGISGLLISGGDERIALGPQGTNKYGCFPAPQPDILSYGSCTASTISETAFAAAAQLYEQLGNTIDAAAHARELDRMRNELAALYGLSGAEIIFSASGTDAHSLAAQLLSRNNTSLFIIMPETAETGSGVLAALQGDNIDVAELKSRADNGDLRPADLVDHEAEALVTRAVAQGKHVLLILADISKTGLIIPSPACALALKQRFAGKLDVLVDACQLRLTPKTLGAYIKQDFLVVITGSKFATGPAFSAALLMPESMGLHAPPPEINYGVLLRWEAALTEMRAFHALPETTIHAFTERFAAAARQRLANDPSFEPLATYSLDRHPLIRENTWDQLPTIFPFRLRHPTSGMLLNKAEATVVYERMKAARYYLGQPVACGALRLCLDMRLIVRGDDTVIGNAMRVLDAAAKTLSAIYPLS